MNRNITFQRQYDPFTAPEPVSDPQGTENFINTIAAFQDPKGTLQRLQAEQVAKTMADLKTDDIDATHQNLANKAINDYIQYAKGLYKNQTGLNRLNLNADQTLQQNQAYKKLIGQVTALKGLSKDYNETMRQATEDRIAGNISKEDYETVMKKYGDALKGATSAEQAPVLRSIYTNYLTENNIKNDWLSLWDKSVNMPSDIAGKNKIENIDPKTGRVIGVTDWDPVQVAMDAARINPRIMKGLLEFSGGDQSKIDAFARSRYGIKKQDIGAKPGNSTNVYNMPSWSKNWQPRYRIIDGELSFNGKTSDGIIMTDQVSGDAGMSLNPGDLFIPKKTFTKDGVRYVSGVTVSKGQGFKATTNANGGQDIEFSSGANLKPITVPVEGSMSNIIESNYFKPDQEGYPDLSVWNKLNKAKTQPTIKTGNLSDAMKKYPKLSAEQVKKAYKDQFNIDLK